MNHAVDDFGFLMVLEQLEPSNNENHENDQNNENHENIANLDHNDNLHNENIDGNADNDNVINTDNPNVNDVENNNESAEDAGASSGAEVAIGEEDDPLPG